MRTLLCAMLLAGLACGAAPPTVPTPEQGKLLRERPWFGVTEKTLEIELKVYGPWHRQVETSAEQLGNSYRTQGKWEQEAKCRRVVIEARRALLGTDHWRTVDARLELAEALAQQKRTPAQRAALVRALTLNAQALVLHRQGQSAKALGPAKEALAIRKEVLGEKHRDHAQSLNNLALLYKNMGDYKQALPLYNQALAINKKVLGEKHPFYALGLNNLSSLYQDMGDYNSALPRYKQALEIYKEALGEKHPLYARALNNLASLYQAMGDYKAALPLFQKALKIKKARGEGPDYALSLASLALLYQKMGDYKAALPLCKQALKINEKALGEKHPWYASSLNNLAGLYYEMGEYKAALPLFEQALAIRKEVPGERHPDYASSLNNLAFLHQKMGEHKRALSLYQQARDVTKKVLGAEHPYYARSLNNLADLYQDMGDHNRALSLFQKARAITKAALGKRHPLYATSLNNLASLYKDMGDHKQALPLYKDARDIRKEAVGEKHPSYARSLNNLASLYKSRRDYKSALPLFQRALQITSEARGEKHPSYATSLNNLAGLYDRMGDHKKAPRLYKKALQIRKEVLGEKHPSYATSLHNLAGLYWTTGNHKQALRLYKQALAINKAALGEKHPGYARSLNSLAGLYMAMGDHKQALPLAEEAAGLTISYLRASAAVQSDRQQFAAAEKLRHQLDVRLSLPDAGSYSHVLAWKGSVFLSQRQRRLFTALSADHKTREIALDLQATTRQIAALSASPKPAREQLERLTKEQERLQAKLSELPATARAAFKADALTPQTLATSLPEGVVLVDFLFFWRYDIVHRDGRGNRVRHLVAFVSRKGMPTARLDLGPAARIEGAASKWRALLTRERYRVRQGAEVKHLVWSPLEKHLAGATTVLISPDGPLAALPFSALPGKKAGTYLIEDVALAVVPVPQLLPEMLKPVDKTKRLKPSLLVVGNVDYARAKAAVAKADVEDLRGAPLGIRRDWGGLPATFSEAAAVSKSFTKLFKKGGTVTDLDGAEATKAKVREALAQVRYAHLATHGFFAHQDIKSALSSKKPDAFFGKEGVTGWHPLLLSGIVLAGANKEPKEGEEDGILTALEVSEMELPKLELVVLSACETGLGKSAGGEGLLGLQRAFQVAGARTVIASLWAVDDKTTRDLMSEFYRVAWDRDNIVSRAEALRRAQLSVLKEGKGRGLGKNAEKLPKGAKPETRLPPYYWAAFVLSGDWR
jgi:tetratricopeptide (TPR) repeat protein